MRTSVVGNYPKVAEDAYGTTLIGAITRWQKQELTGEQLEQVFEEITTAVIREQEQIGIDLITDGQIRWEDIVTPIARRLEGVEINGLTRFYNNNIYYRQPIIKAKPVRTGPILVEEFRKAKRVAQRPLKAVIPGPITFATLCEDRYFKDEAKLISHLAAILNAEARALAEAGAFAIQIDEPSLAYGRAWPKGALKAIDQVVDGVQATTSLRLYFGGVDGRLPLLLKTKVNAIGLDIVTAPEQLAALKKVKLNKIIGLGVVDARNTKLESVKELHAIFEAVKKVVPNERLYVNPNCGLEFLPYEQAKQKLTRLVEAARRYKS